MKLRLLFVAVLLIIGGLGYTYRLALLGCMGSYLIVQQRPKKVDAMVVLSGNAFDRGNEGARLYQAGYTRHILCPGGNLEGLFLILGDTVYESDLTMRNIVRNSVADSLVTAIHYGTSTAEEADTILGYCRVHQLRSVLVVTSLFHTRRAYNVYHKRLEREGIELIVRGAKASRYDEQHWWQNENGLIALNNEYIKLLYYWAHGK